jgi:prevent-host-death family protein
MRTLTVPISEARTGLCALSKQVQARAQVTLTSHGRPAAQLVPVEGPATPRRTETTDDPKRYGDLQLPVMEPWP